MKQLTKTIGDKEVIFQEVPKDSFDYEIIGVGIKPNALTDLWFHRRASKNESICLSPYENLQDKIQLIVLDSITEEQAAKVVESKFNGKIWRDYTRLSHNGCEGAKVFNLKSALESFTTLLKSLGIETVNPLGRRPFYPRYQLNSVNQDMQIMDDYKTSLKEWQAAQSQLWEKVIILTNK